MSNLLKTAVTILSAVVLTITPSRAQNDSWRVVETAGAVRMSQPMTTAEPVSTGKTLSAGAILSTGFNGRAVLVRGDQQIIVGPNSRMSLPASEKSGMTRVVQDLGTLLFKVDKREKHHFRVETPVIAAVVKGTTFTVTAGADTHAVHVAEGAVEVSSRNGMARELVTAGHTARIDRTNPSVIRFSDSPARGDADRKPDVIEQRTDGGGDSANKGVTPIQKASLTTPARAINQPRDLTVPAAIGHERLDFSALTEGLVQSPENGRRAVGATHSTGQGNAVAATFGDALSPANAVAALRLSTTNQNDAARRAVSNNGGSDAKRPANQNGNDGTSTSSDSNGNSGPSSNSGSNGNGNSGPSGNSGGNGNSGSSGNSGSNGKGKAREFALELDGENRNENTNKNKNN